MQVSGCLVLLRVEIAAFHVSPLIRVASRCASRSRGYSSLWLFPSSISLAVDGGTSPEQGILPSIAAGGSAVSGVRCPMELGLSSPSAAADEAAIRLPSSKNGSSQ